MWSKIGDFAGIASWASGIEKSEALEDGKVRRLTVGGGATIVERLIDEGDRSYTYTIEEGPLPVANYRSTLAVAPNGDGKCVVNWEGTFDPVGDENQALTIIGMVYDGGLAAI